MIDLIDRWNTRVGLYAAFLALAGMVDNSMTSIVAMPSGPALSPSVEPLRVSLASPLQSHIAGER